MKQQKLLINGERLKNTLEQFANFGRTENNGVTRLSLSEEDRLARDYFCSCCEELGMSIKIDDMGNIYATLEGLENRPPIVIGSHLDTVKNGGRYQLPWFLFQASMERAIVKMNLPLGKIVKRE